MFFFPCMYDIYARAEEEATASGTAIDDDAYRTWIRDTYRRGQESGYVPQDEQVAPLGVVGFWLVVRLLKENFSESIEPHEKLPMMVPVEGSGCLIGIAKSQDELDMICGFDPQKYVHLTYKVTLRGREDCRALLEFLGEHGMIEKDT